MIWPKAGSWTDQALSHLVSPGLIMKAFEMTLTHGVGVDGNYHHWLFLPWALSFSALWVTNSWWSVASFLMVLFDLQENVHFWQLEGEHRVGHVGTDRYDWPVSSDSVMWWEYADLSTVYFIPSKTSIILSNWQLLFSNTVNAKSVYSRNITTLLSTTTTIC